MRLAWMVALVLVFSHSVGYADQTPQEKCSALNSDTRSCVARGSDGSTQLGRVSQSMGGYCLEGETKVGGGISSGQTGVVGGFSFAYECCCRNKSPRVTDLRNYEGTDSI
jgi:hypothetical protein